ncbi:MAG: DUF2283 domain-containing protein [SAR324 cluster bacterium]|nr:DUF2283 domain-containing protein [SAR324 cluster bacterium]
MKVKYFADTDTALIEFVQKTVFETKEISENVYVDLDQDGNLITMTIEHAKTNAGLWEFSYQEIQESKGYAEQVA